jgi:hypothetical protein
MNPELSEPVTVKVAPYKILLVLFLCPGLTLNFVLLVLAGPRGSILSSWCQDWSLSKILSINSCFNLLVERHLSKFPILSFSALLKFMEGNANLVLELDGNVWVFFFSINIRIPVQDCLDDVKLA